MRKYALSSLRNLVSLFQRKNAMMFKKLLLPWYPKKNATTNQNKFAMMSLRKFAMMYP